MNKKQILTQLKCDVYCRLMRSPISGIGVFAIRNIPRGTDPFVGCFNGKYVTVTLEELNALEPGIKGYVKDVCAFQNGYYYLPSCGIPMIDVSFFLNHSTSPNMRTIDRGDRFVALKSIKKDEELTVDYYTYNDYSKRRGSVGRRIGARDDQYLERRQRPVEGTVREPHRPRSDP